MIGFIHWMFAGDRLEGANNSAGRMFVWVCILGLVLLCGCAAIAALVRHAATGGLLG